MAVAAGVLVLLGGCVSRTAEPVAATPPATPSARTTAATPDPETGADIGRETAAILVSGDVDRFNERICPGTPHIRPVPAIGTDYAHATATEVRSRYLSIGGITTVVRLGIQPGRELALALDQNYNTREWCFYLFGWCPAQSPGLPPFTPVTGHEYQQLIEFVRIELCA
jgi:hypothetical protein